MSGKNNALIHTHDPMLHMVYDENEAIEMFGEEHLEEYGVSLPPELLKRAQKCWEEMKQISAELAQIEKESLHKKYGPPEPKPATPPTGLSKRFKKD